VQIAQRRIVFEVKIEILTHPFPKTRDIAITKQIAWSSLANMKLNLMFRNRFVMDDLTQVSKSICMDIGNK